MGWHVTLDFMTKASTEDLQRFLEELRSNMLLNTHDNEEGQMISIDYLRVDTEARS